MRPDAYRDWSLLTPQARRGGRGGRFRRGGRGRFFGFGSWTSFLAALAVVGIWTLFERFRGERAKWRRRVDSEASQTSGMASTGKSADEIKNCRATRRKK